MRLTFHTRQGCHLCDRLAALIAPHLAVLRAKRPVELVTCDIEDDDAAYEKYWDRIPVLELDGRVLLEGRPEEAEVARVMRGLF